MIRQRVIKLGSTTTAKHCGNCPMLHHDGYEHALCDRSTDGRLITRERWTQLPHHSIYDVERTQECIDEEVSL